MSKFIVLGEIHKNKIPAEGFSDKKWSAFAWLIRRCSRVLVVIRLTIYLTQDANLDFIFMDLPMCNRVPRHVRSPEIVDLCLITRNLGYYETTFFTGTMSVGAI